MKTKLICVSSRMPREPYYHFGAFLRSVELVGANAIVLGMNERWMGLMTKPNIYLKYLKDSCAPDERVILTDCWDVLFVDHPDAISEKCVSLYGGDACVFNGEKACWPEQHLADSFPDQGTPWRYLNSGFICGRADNVAKMIEAMDLAAIGFDRKNPDNTWFQPNDQGEFQKLFPKQPVKMVVDARCELAQTMSACSVTEFNFDGRIKNLTTGTTPSVFHFNGGSKNDLLPIFLRKFRL